MAVQGPSQEYAYQQADEFYEKVLKILDKEHGIRQPSWPRMEEDHEKGKAMLKEGLRELFWTEACNSW